jgi:hypothetical protein
MAAATATANEVDKKMELMKEVRLVAPPSTATLPCFPCSSSSFDLFDGTKRDFRVYYSVRFVKIRAHEVAIGELNNLPPSRVSLPPIPRIHL